MADRLSFGAYDAANVPLTGLTPAFVHYVDRTGTPRTPPAITELGGGQYGFSPTDADESVGTVFLIDLGATSTPRRVSGAIHTPTNPFLAWHLEDVAGALWTGAAPTVGLWDDFAGVPRTPPAVVALATYLFAVTPSTDDLAVDVAFRFDSAAGAQPPYLTGSVEAQPWAAPSPASSKNPALDVVNFLNTKAAGALTMAKGTNLFVGPERSFPRTPATCLFALNTGGPGPSPYLGGHRTALYRPTVQLLVRAGAGDLEGGEAIARAVQAWLQQHALTGYITLFVRDSAPVYLGEFDQRHRWAINVECLYRVDLAA